MITQPNKIDQLDSPKTSAILTYRYLRGEIQQKYGELCESVDGDYTQETQKRVQIMAFIRDKVLVAIGGQVKHAIGKKSEFNLLCEKVGTTIDEGFEEAITQFKLLPDQVIYYKTLVEAKRMQIGNKIIADFDFEDDEDRLVEGVDYLTCIDTAALQLRIFLFSLAIDHVYKPNKCYTCVKCAKIHDTQGDIILLKAVELLSFEVIDRFIRDIKKMRQANGSLRFNQLRKTTVEFLKTRLQNVGFHYGLKGVYIVKMRGFIQATIKAFELLDEETFLAASILPEFAGLFGNTRACFRNDILRTMKKNDVVKAVVEPTAKIELQDVPTQQSTPADQPEKSAETPASNRSEEHTSELQSQR